MSSAPYVQDGDGVRLTVRVTPRASRNAIAGIVEQADGRTALAIRLAAPPVEGAANEALVGFLAAALAVPRKAVRIESGETARLKRVRIDGVSVETVAARLR